jgi:DNA adenine methylase
MKDTATAKPFIKWVGGKTKLIPKLANIIASNFNSKIPHYVEPFIGGGALFFWLKSNNIIANSVISDINPDLILTYKTIQNHVFELIESLNKLETKFLALNPVEQEAMFYNVRKEHNALKNIKSEDDIDHAIKKSSTFIFLNKTCFNGLYRQNNSGEFNVPFGKYKKPVICDHNNLIACNKLLENVLILCGDFTATESLITSDSLVYLDPPYKPLTQTSSFTKYHVGDFNDDDQIRLANFYKDIDKIGAKIILSNSDPSSVDSQNTFFDDLYEQFNITRVEVSRNISANASGRKCVTELIIKNIK